MLSVMYTVLIRNNATGEVRPYVMDYDWDEVAEYMWDGGNYGCDCNRGLFFYGDEDVEDVDCGETAFSVRIVALDGSVLSEEHDFAA